MKDFVIGDKVRLNQPWDLTRDGMLILKKGVQGSIVNLKILEEGLCADIQLSIESWWIPVEYLNLVIEEESTSE